jgi:hypothetical protein
MLEFLISMFSCLKKSAEGSKIKISIDSDCFKKKKIIIINNQDQIKEIIDLIEKLEKLEKK